MGRVASRSEVRRIGATKPRSPYGPWWVEVSRGRTLVSRASKQAKHRILVGRASKQAKHRNPADAEQIRLLSSRFGVGRVASSSPEVGRIVQTKPRSPYGPWWVEVSRGSMGFLVGRASKQAKHRFLVGRAKQASKHRNPADARKIRILSSRFEVGRVASSRPEVRRIGYTKPRSLYDPRCVEVYRGSLRGRRKSIPERVRNRLRRPTPGSLTTQRSASSSRVRAHVFFEETDSTKT